MSSSNRLLQDTAHLTWTINNFQNENSLVHSAKFESISSKHQFMLSMHRNAYSLNLDHVMLRLYYTQASGSWQFHYRVAIVDLSGEKKHLREYIWNFIKGPYSYSEYNITNYIHREAIRSDLLVNGNLTLSCEVEIFPLELPSANPDTAIKSPIMQNYEKLLESGKFSDITFTVSGKEFHLHKNILSAQSVVFEAMFEHECEETAKNQVELTDIDEEPFQELLGYIYAGKIPQMENYALELFSISDKYQLEELKTICEEFLSTNLDIETVANTFVLADMHNASQLKAKCIVFINANSAAVRQTDGWRNLVKNRVELVVELYENKCDKP